ncbi:12514_t:CDS:2 [Entrophospora sp. SA101]|nr:12514_t:CDS:2 [Entrophospora sp. SA101]
MTVPTLPGVFIQNWDFGTLKYNSNQATGCNGPNMPAYQVNIPISNVFWNPPIVAGAPNVRGIGDKSKKGHLGNGTSAWHDANSAQHGHLQNPTPDLPAYQVNISISDIFWDLQIVAGAQMLGSGFTFMHNVK